jgi:hypothetical protein
MRLLAVVHLFGLRQRIQCRFLEAVTALLAVEVANDDPNEAFVWDNDETLCASVTVAFGFP